MKILAIHNTLWTHYKGDIYSRIHARLIKSNTLEFNVIHLAFTENGRSVLGEADLEQHQYPYEVLFNQALEEIPTQRKISTLLKRVAHLQPNLIYLNGYYDTAYWVVMLYAKSKGIKVIIDCESNEISRERIWWKELLKKIVIPQLDGYLCLGTKATDYIIKLGVNPKKIFSTRNIGIANDKVLRLYQSAYCNREATKKQLNLPKFNFIYAGRFTAIKNLAMLIEAFDELSTQFPMAYEWGLILSGDGEEKKMLQQIASAKNTKQITFLPSCQWNEVPSRYSLADVAILPSLFEPFGFLVNEALVYGMPVIVSNRCGSAHDLVKDNINGYTFDPTQKQELVQKMQKMVTQSTHLKQMGSTGQELVAYFHPDAICEDIIKSFNTVLNP